YFNTCFVRVGGWIRGVRIGRIDSDVMMRESLDQLTICCNGPLFDVCCQPVGVRKKKIRTCCLAVFYPPLCWADEGGNHGGEGRRRVTGVFLPSVLAGNRALQDQVRGCPHDHNAWIKQPDGVLFVQTPCQQYRRGNLVELQAGPISGPIDPTVLRKTAIRPLNSSKPGKRSQRGACLAF